MKNKSFPKRFRFAWQGIGTTWKGERSFRTQVVLGAGAIGILGILRPSAIWWAVFFLIIGAVLAGELFNTALEKIVDHLHPESHPMIGLAKDCAAGGVLVLSLAAVGILLLLIAERVLS